MTMDLDTERRVMLSINDVVGDSIAVLDSKGSGKTKKATLLIEEILCVGACRSP